MPPCGRILPLGDGDRQVPAVHILDIVDQHAAGAQRPLDMIAALDRRSSANRQQRIFLAFGRRFGGWFRCRYRDSRIGRTTGRATVGRDLGNDRDGKQFFRLSMTDQAQRPSQHRDG